MNSNMPSEYFYFLLGGALIGSASVLLLLADGKIAGISGILGGLLRAPTKLEDWRCGFLGGLLMGGFAMQGLGWPVFVPLPGRSTASLIVAGLLVGFGTQLGSGCTSGHGVCGLGRLSPRSLTATLVFMAAGAAVVFFIRRVLGGAV